MIGRKKSPETEIGILNVRLHQIGIRGRIWTYLAEGYNFVIVSCICDKKNKKITYFYFKYIYFFLCCLCLSLLSAVCVYAAISVQIKSRTPYVKGLTYLLMFTLGQPDLTYVHLIIHLGLTQKTVRVKG